MIHNINILFLNSVLLDLETEREREIACFQNGLMKFCV